MKDNEKQIKLLTKRISKIQNKGVKDIPNFTTIFIDNQELAEELLKYYQPKLPKHSVVLSGEQCVEIVQDNYNIGYERGCKETAQKFYEFAKAWFEYYEQNDYFEEVKNLAEQCGVEIKE